MPKQPQQPHRETEQSPNETPTDRLDERGPSEPLDYESLLQRYGDAMLRIGHLESRLDQLTPKLQASAAVPLASRASSDMADAPYEPAHLADLVDRIELIERDMSIEPMTRSDSGAKGGDTGPNQPPRRDDEEVAQLRLQVLNLASQLSRTEKQIKDSQSGRRRPRSRSGRPPKWQFWRA